LNTVAPPRPVAKPRDRATSRCQEPGGKGFQGRIQVQYPLPKACTPKTPCGARRAAHAHRRRLYAFTPLPGDTNLVLGREGRFAERPRAPRQAPLYITGHNRSLSEGAVLDPSGSRGPITRLLRVVLAKGEEALSWA